MATRREAPETADAVFDRMRADHRAVLEGSAAMLANATAIARGAKRRAAAETALRGATTRLARQFATHMRAEDDVIYPAVERALPSSRERLMPLRAEHEELRSMLSDLRRKLSRPATAARDEQVEVLTRDLVDLLRIHIRKEEAIVFTLAEQLIPPDRLKVLVGRLRNRPPGRAPRRGAAEPDLRCASGTSARRRPATGSRTKRAKKAATPARARTKPKRRTR